MPERLLSEDISRKTSSNRRLSKPSIFSQKMVRRPLPFKLGADPVLPAPQDRPLRRRPDPRHEGTDRRSDRGTG